MYPCFVGLGCERPLRQPLPASARRRQPGAVVQEPRQRVPRQRGGKLAMVPVMAICIRSVMLELDQA